MRVWATSCKNTLYNLRVNTAAFTVFVVGIMEDPHTRYSKRLVSNLDEPVAISSIFMFVWCFQHSRQVFLVQNASVPHYCFWQADQRQSRIICEEEPVFLVGTHISLTPVVLLWVSLQRLMNLSKEFRKKSSSQSDWSHAGILLHLITSS